MIDSDEFIVPQKDKDIDTMIKRMEGIELGALKILNTILFYWLWRQYTKYNSTLSTIRSLNHLPPEQKLHTKYLVAPKACLLAYTHFCKVLQHALVVRVDAAIGRSQHYKACSTARHSESRYNCNFTGGHYEYDDGILQFESHLVTAVSKVMADMDSL